MARFDSAPPILSSRLVAWRSRPGCGGTARTIVSPIVITSRFSANRTSPLFWHYLSWGATLLVLVWSPPTPAEESFGGEDSRRGGGQDRPDRQDRRTRGRSTLARFLGAWTGGGGDQGSGRRSLCGPLPHRLRWRRRQPAAHLPSTARPRRGHQRHRRFADPRPHRPHRPRHRATALRGFVRGALRSVFHQQRRASRGGTGRGSHRRARGRGAG